MNRQPTGPSWTTTLPALPPAIIAPADDPLIAALHRILRHHPQLEAIAGEATLLARAGAVLPGLPLSELGAVAGELARFEGAGFLVSVDGWVVARDFYTVTCDDARVACDCYAYRRGLAPAVPGLGFVCAHILAAVLASRPFWKSTWLDR